MPESAKKVTVDNVGRILCYYINKWEWIWSGSTHVNLIGKLSELTEDQASEVVDNKPTIIEPNGDETLTYRNYLYHDIQALHIWKESALDSLNSLLQANDIDSWDKENAYIFKN